MTPPGTPVAAGAFTVTSNPRRDHQPEQARVVGLGLDSPIAEFGVVVIERVRRAIDTATEFDVEEVGGCGVVGAPAATADLHPVPGVADDEPVAAPGDDPRQGAVSKCAEQCDDEREVGSAQVADNSDRGSAKFWLM
jgi:hypothetical protein